MPAYLPNEHFFRSDDDRFKKPYLSTDTAPVSGIYRWGCCGYEFCYKRGESFLKSDYGFKQSHPACKQIDCTKVLLELQVQAIENIEEYKEFEVSERMIRSLEHSIVKKYNDYD